MRKVALQIGYDGRTFSGWQRQNDVSSIQGTLEEAFFRCTQCRIAVVGASRTDRNVSAIGQVAHMTLPDSITIASERLAAGINFYLPSSIRVLKSLEVPLNFHAQRSALCKTYEYSFWNARWPNPLYERSLHVPYQVDWQKIKLALTYFLGTHDFGAFAAGAISLAGGSVRTLLSLDLLVDEKCPSFYRLRIEGTGFLKQMIRRMVGTLLAVGQRRLQAEDIRDILLSGDRSRGGKTMPGEGLVLTSITYSKEFAMLNKAVPLVAKKTERIP